MPRWRKLLFDVTFALNILLLFLLFFENKLHVPAWLQVVGRMHTLFLHFPIVMLALCIFWELFSGFKKSYTGVRAEIGDELLLIAAITSVITALMGLFLSKEDGYTPTLLLWHKWGGVFISFFSLAWFVFRIKLRQIKPALLITALAAMVMIIITGHLGGNITHGQDFLIAPISSENQKPAVLFEDALVYNNMVEPILAEKCMSCHNAQKAKGSLILETKEMILKGGKDGKLWDSTQNDFGLLMQRIHLPLQNKKHMPPKGKPQLTEEEGEILYRWIKSGASFTTKVSSLPEKDSLRKLASTLFQTIETDDYKFDPPDDKKVKALNNNYRLVRSLAENSPALGVEFFSAEQFKPDQLKELLVVKDQIISLNLNKMPVNDEDLKTIGQLVNLRKLNLSFTNITGATLPELNHLKELKILSVSGTKISSANLQFLKALPKLTELFVWNTSISSIEIKKLRQILKTTDIETGFDGDTIVIKLNPPIIENEDQVIMQPETLMLKHYVKGVSIRYTSDGKDPDSINSPVYQNIVILDRKQTIKAKAFKPGWLSSDVAEKTFYKAGIMPDSVQLLTQPDPFNKGDGALTLFDGKIGTLNFRDGKWLGYHGQPLEAYFYFNKPVIISSVTVSSIVDILSYIMPPTEIQIWGGDSENALHLLKELKPIQPTKEKPAYFDNYEIKFKTAKLKIIKIVMRSVVKLPSWHKGKGQKGWIYVDEVFFN